MGPRCFPFTSWTVLLWETCTRERARGARRHPPGDPGSRPQVNASAIFSRTQRLALIPQLQQLLCRYGFRSNSAGVESPLKPANRRPDDKVWTPGMAARGETRQDVESSRPWVSRTGGERSAQHRFPCGAAGIDKGAAVAPLSRSRVTHVICSALHEVNGTHMPESHISLLLQLN